VGRSEAGAAAVLAEADERAGLLKKSSRN